VRTSIASTATPLGIDLRSDYTTSPPVGLGAGELVFFYTDGIVQACSPDQTPFGIDRALAVLRALRHEPPDRIVGALLEAVRRHCGPVPPVDDMTAVIVKVSEP